jgi:hypothetical protein
MSLDRPTLPLAATNPSNCDDDDLKAFLFHHLATHRPPLRRSLPPAVPSPSADQHRARVSSLVRRIGVALSVSGTGAPNLSLILLTLSNRFIVLLVRLVTTSGATTRPRLLAPRTLVPTYASCSAPRVCLAFSPIDFPLP